MSNIFVWILNKYADIEEYRYVLIEEDLPILLEGINCVWLWIYHTYPKG